MKGIAITVLVYVALIFICGCKSINVGGSGQVGTVTGGGSVNIPVPNKEH